MNKLDRYIGISFLKGFFLVTLILLTLFNFLIFVEELEDVGKGDYRVLDALAYVVFTTPGRFLDLMPFAALLGCLFALGALANGSELIVMRASGISIPRIGWALIKTSFVLMLAALILMELLIPPLEQLALARRSLVSSNSTSLNAAQGIWYRIDQRFIHINSFLLGRNPSAIDIYEFDPGGRLRVFTHAREALVQSPTQWLLQDVDRRVFTEQDMIRQHYETLPWQPGLSSEKLAILGTPPASQAPSVLYRFLDQVQQRDQSSYRYELMLWEKSSIPLAIPVLLLLSMPFLFGSMRKASAGHRIMLGSAIGIGFYLINQIAGHLGQLANLNPALIVFTPLALMLVVALWLANRKT